MTSLTNDVNINDSNKLFELRVERIFEYLRSRNTDTNNITFPEFIVDGNVFKNAVIIFGKIKKKRVKKKDSEYFNNCIIKFMIKELDTDINWQKKVEDGLILKKKKSRNKIIDVINKFININIRCSDCKSLNSKFKREKTTRGIFDKFICINCEKL